MSMQFKAKAKRWIGFLMAALLVCNLIPASIFATSSSEYASRVAYSGGTLYYDAKGNEVGSNSDYAVKISKTAEQGDKEHEFDITLTVTPKDKEVEIKKKIGADIVLVFDVSTSMDYTTNNNTPSHSAWKLEETRWTALKAAADRFIDEM
ncbi:MAG TPA: hypothetical protein GX701_03805, partial [Clostridiales bacterium]|nr:hypothetical protein [Clostridiales bacterium]